MDIEDLTMHCPKKEECKSICSPKPFHLIFPDGRQWIKVIYFTELFNTFDVIGDTPYMLVAGNTARGE